MGDDSRCSHKENRTGEKVTYVKKGRQDWNDCHHAQGRGRVETRTALLVARDFRIGQCEIPTLKEILDL